ncbi:MAG: hypothetical protein ACREL5_10000 [Gemmatimonadales bacterium]
MRRLTMLVALICLTGARAGAQRFFSTGVADKDVQAYLDHLQKAAATNQRAAVAGLVAFPLRVNRGVRSHFMIADRAELLRRYDAVFTPAIRTAIVSQRYADLYVNSGEIAVGRGAVWLKGICTRRRPITCHLAVTSVNLATGG